MKYSLSVICFNRLGLTRRCLRLVRETMPLDAELIITDNGSREEVRREIDLIASTDRVTVIRHGANEGVIRPKNLALETARGAYFLSLDNDCVPTPGWVERLCEPLESDTEVVQVGRRQGFGTLTRQGIGVRGERVDYIDGSCFAVRVDVARRLGLCDEVYEFAYCEDSDFSLRARKAGHKITTAPAGVRHEEHGTAGRMDLQRIWQRNHARFVKRWHGYLQSKTFGHPGEPPRGIAQQRSGAAR